MIRTLVLLAVLMMAGGAAGQPPKLDAKAAEAKLKKFRDADKPDVKSYKPGEWEAVRDNNPDLKKAAKAIDDLADGLSGVRAAAKNLAGAIDKNETFRKAE